MINPGAMETMQWSEHLSSPNNHGPGAPTIKNHSVTHFNGYLFCFGGYDGRRNHMTLLLYSIAEQRWIEPHHVGATTSEPAAALSDTNILVTGTPPPGRNGHSATLATDPDDEASRENARLIIIGGWLGTGPLAASDMHVLDITNGGRQLRWFQPAVKGTPPGPCNMHSADFVRDRREVYVFRGGNGREYLNDLHALCTTTFTWRKVETTGAIPQQRANHSSAILDETGELFIFGGWNGKERLNDIHILDTATSTWTCPQAGGVLPHPRAGMTLTALRGRLYLFGGSGTSSKCFQDLQILDRSEMAWLDVTQYEGSNSCRQRYESDYGHHHMSHEATGQDEMNSQWRFDGAYQPDGPGGSMQDGSARPGGFSSMHSDWRARDMVARPRLDAISSASPNPNDEDSVPSVMIQGRGPGRRAGHTATAVGRNIYVFGGSCGSDYLNDFYVLDTDPAPHAGVTHSTSLKLVERRLRHFFNDEDFSDVTFLVQGRRVYGHKMVLSIVSDCFRAMFTSGFRETDSMEIEIQDCSYEAFVALMEYVYTGQTSKIDPGQGQDVNASQVVEILELADRFILDHLKQVCETALQPAINSDTVDYFLQVAQKTNSMQLQAICEHLIRNP